MSRPPFSPPPHLGSPALRAVPGVFFALFLTVAFGIGAYGARAPEGAPTFGDGAWAAAFEERFNEEHAVRPAGMALWGAVDWFVFGDPRKGARAGAEGWLFSDEELAGDPRERPIEAEHVALVAGVHRHLRARNIALRVALIPSKARVHPEALGGIRVTEEVDGRYARALAALRSEGIDAPDLATPLRAAAADRPMFLRTDTHWTPEGAAVVAQEIAVGLAFPSRGSKAYRAVPQAAQAHRGDLLAYVPLGPLAAYGPPPDALGAPLAEADAADLAAALFGDAPPAVLLVGSSYSDDARFGFRDALRVALQAEVIEAAEPGRGPFLPMLAWLEHPDSTKTPPEVVIWEIPERYLRLRDDPKAHPAARALLGLGG